MQDLLTDAHIKDFKVTDITCQNKIILLDFDLYSDKGIFTGTEIQFVDLDEISDLMCMQDPFFGFRLKEILMEQIDNCSFALYA